jgi:hypothetical protein
MPSWHPLTQTGPRFGILPALGRSSRLLGHGQPRPIRWFSRIVWGARIKWAPYDKGDVFRASPDELPAIDIHSL